MAGTNAKAVFHTLNTQTSVSRKEDLTSCVQLLCIDNARLQEIGSTKELVPEKANGVDHA